MLADLGHYPLILHLKKDKHTSAKRRVRGLDTTDPLEAVDDLIVSNRLPTVKLEGDWRESQESTGLIIAEQVFTLLG